MANATAQDIFSIQEDGKYHFDKTRIVTREPKDLTSGARIISMFYKQDHGTSPLLLEMPTLYAPMGKSVFDNGGAGKHSILLSFRDYDTNTQVQELAAFMGQLDEHIRELAVNNSRSWFKKVYKRDTLDELYSPMLRLSKDEQGVEDGRYPPSLRLALPMQNGKPSYDAFDRAGKPLDLDSIETRGAKVTAIIALQNIWVAGGNSYGISPKAVQLMVEPRPVLSGFAFRNMTPSADAPKQYEYSDDEEADGDAAAEEADVAL